MFDPKQLTEHSKAQSRAIAVAAKFLGMMGYGKPPAAGKVSFGAQYDSIVANAKQAKTRLDAIIPQPILDLEKVLMGKKGPNGERSFDLILDSIQTGCEAHRNRNGGDMPSAAVLAVALTNAAQQYTGLTLKDTDGIFDSATDQNHSFKEYMLDSVSSENSAYTAEVPTLAMVTIATTLANAMPLVAYLPNPKGSQTVPLLYVRQIAKMNLGQTRKDDFLDGINAAKQYFNSVHRLEMETADNKTFTVEARRCVLPGTNKPDPAAGVLPMVAGASLITIDGIPIAQDEQNHRSSGSTSGSLPIYPIDQEGVTLNNVTYKSEGGSVNLDAYTVTITFDKALPAGTKVMAHVVANYEAKDGANTPILVSPSIDAKLEYDSVSAHGFRAHYVASIDALTQMQNELGVDQRAAFVATVISKLMLEQNIDLLQQARNKAHGLGIVRGLDIMRGSSMTQAFNRTADIAAELIPAIEEMKRRIIAKTTHAPDGFDIFVTGAMGTMARTLADDTNFIPSGLTLGAPNNIARIGSRTTDNYHYLPEEAGVLEFGEDVVNGQNVHFSEILIVARNGVPAKSQFVGHIPVPVVTEDVRATMFENGVTFYTRQVAQMNRNKRYGSQVGVLKVFNLPASLTQEV